MSTVYLALGCEEVAAVPDDRGGTGPLPLGNITGALEGSSREARLYPATTTITVMLVSPTATVIFQLTFPVDGRFCQRSLTVLGNNLSQLLRTAAHRVATAPMMAATTMAGIVIWQPAKSRRPSV